MGLVDRTFVNESQWPVYQPPPWIKFTFKIGINKGWPPDHIRWNCSGAPPLFGRFGPTAILTEQASAQS